MDLSRLLEPRSVAVVGATDRPGSYARVTIENLRDAGFRGSVLGVHPTRSEVLGIRCVPSLADAGRVDAVVVATPAPTVPGILRQARDLGCGGAIVYAAGFTELGARAAHANLVGAAGGLPVIGPNCNGLVSVAARAPLWGDSVVMPPPGGSVALITQSGNVGVVALAHRRGIGLHTVVSIGNAAVVSAADVLAHLAITDGVRAVALYLEADGEGAALAEAFALCAERDVRLAVLKAGRSVRGAAMGAAHTDALLGDQKVFTALVQAAGGAMVRDPHELLETARTLAQGRRDPRGLALLASSGGDAALAADLAFDAGARLTTLTATTADALVPLLPAGVPAINPLDHTNAVWADTAAIASIAEKVAQDPDVGHLAYCQDEPPGMSPEAAEEWRATRAGGAEGAVRAGMRALLVCTTPGQEPSGEEVPPVSGLQPLMVAISVLQRPAPSADHLRAIAAAARGRVMERAGVPEHAAKEMLARMGVSVPDGRTVSTADDAVRVAQELGTPVALKLSAPGITHKARMGALALGVEGAAEVRAEAERLLALAGEDACLLVERMVVPGLEVIVAATRAGVVPSLMVGLGGAQAEELNDVAAVPLPASVVEAVAALRGRRLLDGHPALGSLATVADAAAALLLEGWSLVELNPVILTPAGAVVVDAVMR